MKSFFLALARWPRNDITRPIHNPWWVIGWRCISAAPAFVLIYAGRALMLAGGFLFRGPEGFSIVWENTSYD